MDIVCYLDNFTGLIVAVFDAQTTELNKMAAEILWRCEVCGSQGKRIAHWHEAPSFSHLWADLGAVCCSQPSVVISLRSVGRRYTACVFFPSCRLYQQVLGKVVQWVEKDRNLLGKLG